MGVVPRPRRPGRSMPKTQRTPYAFSRPWRYRRAGWRTGIRGHPVTTSRLGERHAAGHRARRSHRCQVRLTGYRIANARDIYLGRTGSIVDTTARTETTLARVDGYINDHIGGRVSRHRFRAIRISWSISVTPRRNANSAISISAAGPRGGANKPESKACARFRGALHGPKPD